MALIDDKKDKTAAAAPAPPPAPAPTPAPSVAQRVGAGFRSQVDAVTGAVKSAAGMVGSAGSAVGQAVGGVANDLRAGYIGRRPEATAAGSAAPAPGAIAPRLAPPRPGAPMPVGAGPSPSLAGTPSTLTSPAPNTFVGSNGVRTIDRATGAPQQTLGGRGSFSIGPVGSAPTGGIVARPTAPAASPALAGGIPQVAPRPTPSVDPDVAWAQARNAATHDRASLFTAGDIGVDRFHSAPDIGEMDRRLKNALRGNLTASARESLIRANSENKAAIFGSAAEAQKNAAGLAAGEQRETGATERAALQDDGDTARANLAAEVEVGEGTRNRATQLLRPITTLTGADGTVGVLGGDGRISLAAGQDGQPFRTQRPRAEGEVTPALQYEAAASQLAELLATPPSKDPAAAKAYQDQIGALQARMNQLANPGQAQGGGAARVGTSPDGKPVFRAADGSLYTEE
jgi:hypothetical protein